MGGGRYSVFFEGVRQRGEPLFFLSREMPAFSITPRLDGAIAIGAFYSDTAAQRKFMASGAEIDGTLNVIVEEGVTVLRHNAPNEPLRHGLFEEYSWRIRSYDADPWIIIQSLR